MQERIGRDLALTALSVDELVWSTADLGDLLACTAFPREIWGTFGVTIPCRLILLRLEY